jgi:hypothetical protein
MGCRWLIFGYICYNFGLDLLATLPLMEPGPMPEDRNTMVANNFEALAAASGGGKPRPGKP